MNRTMTGEEIFLPVGRGGTARKIAARVRKGASPGLIWLAGLMADMGGIKGTALEQWADEHRRACVRFDYSGHGKSGGTLIDGTIGRWLTESVAVFDAYCEGPQVVVGSSMGAWLALLLARELGRRASPISSASLAGMVLISPAVDFTEELIWKRLPIEAKREIETTGVWEYPSQYLERPYLITRDLIDDGRRHLLLGGLIQTRCPVRILQGVKDPDVPWRHALELLSRLTHDDVVLSLVKDGDHRLSRPQDIKRLLNAIAEF
jgi:pimeloyl-ACP methyl ester carboxylesterase